VYRVSSWQRTFRHEPPPVLALFCVDGRYSRYIDEFLESHLRLEGADWLAVPGGPAALADRSAAEGDADYVWREIEFLVNAHRHTRALLVCHEHCGHYDRVLEHAGSPEERAEAQKADALLAASRLTERFPDLQVEVFWQHADDHAVYFERVKAESVDAT